MLKQHIVSQAVLLYVFFHALKRLEAVQPKSFGLCGYMWKINDGIGVPLAKFYSALNLPADFGVSAKNTKTLQRRDSFIGTPYW